MKKRTEYIISTIAIIVIILAVLMCRGTFRPFSTSSEWKKEGLILTSEDYNQQNPDIIELLDGCWRMYTHGHSKNIDENNIYSFYSCDGLEWKYEGLRIKSAAMPAAVMLEDGRTRLYFQKGIERNAKPAQALMSAVSKDGLNFTIEDDYLLITEEGELKDIRTIAHFEIIKLEKGYRIYFDEGGLRADELERNKGTGWNWPVHWIRSIYSEDGLSWELEPRIRINIEQEPLVEMQRAGSCSVIKQGGMYHMFFSAGFSPWEDLKPWKRWEWSGTYEAVSDNGLDFTIIDKRLVTGGDVKVTKSAEDNTFRMYVSEGSLMPQGKNDIYLYTKSLE